MKRLVFNLAAIASVLILAGLIVLWVLTRRQSVTAYRTNDSGLVGMGVGGGETAFFRINLGGNFFAPGQPLFTSHQWRTERMEITGDPMGPDPPPTPGLTYHRVGGFLYLTFVEHGIREVWAVAAPIWTFMIPASLFPFARVLRHRRNRRRSRQGLCQTCGYDLRATPDRCPECGAIVENTTERILATDGHG